MRMAISYMDSGIWKATVVAMPLVLAAAAAAAGAGVAAGFFIGTDPALDFSAVFAFFFVFLMSLDSLRGLLLRP